jgi:hypothetical protein
MIAAAVVLSKSFNNGFDFERGLWWRKMGAAAYAPKTSVFERSLITAVLGFCSSVKHCDLATMFLIPPVMR